MQRVLKFFGSCKLLYQELRKVLPLVLNTTTAPYREDVPFVGHEVANILCSREVSTAEMAEARIGIELGCPLNVRRSQIQTLQFRSVQDRRITYHRTRYPI